MLKYLREESYYQNRYDLSTIEDCLHTIESFRTLLKKQSLDKELGKPSSKEKAETISKALNYRLYIIKGEHYRNKSSTIHEWMQQDRRRDERFEAAREPADVSCPACGRSMAVILKELMHCDGDMEKVLFFLECSSCGKRKGIYDDGEPFVPRAHRCPKCQGDVKFTHRKRDRVSTLSTVCSSCKFREDDIYDADKEAGRQAEKEKTERELLDKYRSEFCLSPREGGEYIESMNRLEWLGEFFKEQQHRRTDPNYQKLAELKRLSIVALEKQLSEAIGQGRYARLVLEKPELGRHVIVPFMAQDADSSRNEHDSVRKLQKIMKAALAGTNWRLMSEGVFYKLGYLSGRLKGYDLEEDLLKLMKEGE